MDPISKEYSYTVEALREELGSFKREQSDLRREISKLFQENRRLTNELRESMLMKDHELSEKGIRDLERKLLSANAAKETALAMWQEAMQQLERQDKLLIGKKSLVETERSEVVKSMDQIKEQYQKGLATLSAELSSCRSDLSSAKQELHSKVSDLEKCKSNLETTKQELIDSQKSMPELSLAKTELDEKLTSMQLLLSEKENILCSTKEKLEVVVSQNLKLSSLVADLKEQNKKLKYDSTNFEKDAKESLFTAQEAILQRKEMAYREEQYLKEIDILKSSSGIDVQKLELKCKAKIKEIHEQTAEKIQSLMEEIQQLHKETGEKQSLFEKVQREKKALESQLELLCSESSCNPVANRALDDLCKRLTLAESARDEYELRLKSLQADLEELKSSKEQVVNSFVKERSILKERLLNLSKDCNQSLTDRLKLREEVTGLKKRCYELEKELKSTKSRHSQEFSSLKSEAQQKQQSSSEQLRLVEDHYKTVCGELQHLLESQFKISNKWKEESEDLISKSESKIIELCDTIAHLQYQNEELVSVMQHNNSYKHSRTAF